MKRNADIAQLASSCGFPQLGNWIQQARAIAYSDTPNYDVFRTILQQIASTSSVAPPKNKKSSSTHAPPLVDMDASKVKRRKESSTADVAHGIENVLHVDNLKDVPIKKTSKTTKKTGAAKEAVTRYEVVDLDNTSGNYSSATTKRKKTTTESLHKTPIQPSHSIIDMVDSDEEEGSPTPKKETKKKRSALPPPGPFTAELPSPSQQSVLLRRSSRLSKSPSSNKKAKVAMPSIVLKDTATNRTVTVATDHAVLLGRDDNAAMCIDDGYVSESHAHVQTIVGKDATLRLRVMDLKSSNGTKVNGKKITPKRWHTAEMGDIITLGMTNLVVDCQAVDA